MGCMLPDMADSHTLATDRSEVFLYLAHRCVDHHGLWDVLTAASTVFLMVVMWIKSRKVARQ